MEFKHASPLSQRAAEEPHDGCEEDRHGLNKSSQHPRHPTATPHKVSTQGLLRNGVPADERVKDEDLKVSMTCSPSAKGPAQGSNGARPLEHICHRCEGTSSAICAMGINEYRTLSPLIATNSTRAAGPLGQTLSWGVPLQTPQSAMAMRRQRKCKRYTLEPKWLPTNPKTKIYPRPILSF